MMYEFLCHAEKRRVLCHTTDLRRIQPLEGAERPPIYVVHFECPNDHLLSLNLCTAGHLDLVYYSDPRLESLSALVRQEFQGLLIARLESYDQLTYKDFLREIGELSA